MSVFEKALPVFAPGMSGCAGIQVGLYTAIWVDDNSGKYTVRVTARNVYRMYINGKMAMHGPARTAHGYVRADEFDIGGFIRSGINHIAVEVVAYGKSFGTYSNDSTLEDGLFICEISKDEEIISATGIDNWKCLMLDERKRKAERISHCRECMEIYTLDRKYVSWRTGDADFSDVEALHTDVKYLRRHALLPTLEIKNIERLVSFGSCRIDTSISPRPLFYEGWSQEYNYSLDERPLFDCRRTVEESSYDISVTRDADRLTFSGETDKYALFDVGESHVGFFGIDVTFEYDGILDIVHTELLKPDGSSFYPFNITTRLHLSAGRYEFRAMDPSLMRYIRLYMRTPGSVTLYRLDVCDYTYPDQHKSTFFCSDDNVNRLYSAAKRTLLLNTTDIFMDCPDRERGGWLCDSLWTARAAALMLSDTSVEYDFLENFLLTENTWKGFFPEVYPANKDNYSEMTGLTTWSFWLMCELCEFVTRTNATGFAERFRSRVEEFVDGTRAFIGKSGCIENIPFVFIDWSLSNKPEYNQPVSVAVNSLYAYMMNELGKLYSHSDWISLSDDIFGILRKATGVFENSEIDLFPDNLKPDGNGGLHGTDYHSEAAIYTSLWSGLFNKGELPALDIAVRDKMGPDPVYSPYPSVGRSGLFIGLCIRLDMLARRGDINKAFTEIKAIYEPQLREGPGTLWENSVIDTSSRCHGFNSFAGAILMRDVLGISIPDEKEHIITLSPHPCGLRFASGTITVGNSLLSVSWKLYEDRFVLNAQIPEGYFVKYELPREILALGENNISINIM